MTILQPVGSRPVGMSDDFVVATLPWRPLAVGGGLQGRRQLKQRYAGADVTGGAGGSWSTDAVAVAGGRLPVVRPVRCDSPVHSDVRRCRF